MNTKEITLFLEKNNLSGTVKKNTALFERIIKECLSEKGSFIILTDKGNRHSKSAFIYASLFYFAARNLGMNPKLVVQSIKRKGKQKAERRFAQRLSTAKKGSTVIVSTSANLGSLGKLTKSFRTYCEKKKYRYISTTGLLELPTTKFSRMINCLNVDYKEMDRKSVELYGKLRKAKTIRITTKAGTDLTAEICDGKPVRNSGIYKKAGTGGNLPAGEVYFAPTLGTANGTVVIDASIKHANGTSLVKKPFRIIIKDGRAVEIEPTRDSIKLIETLNQAEKKSKKPETVRMLGEIGIGINSSAEIAGPTIINEKMLGTAHIALGSNYWFGGKIYCIVHLDQVFRNPTIYLDGEKIKI
jgi:leucyl aminopeptidase (aminopeptidase T)